MTRLKAVIELGRVIRDKRTLKTKVSLSTPSNADQQMPLKELIVFHHDQQYLDDVKSLESYIAGELNVVNVVYTSDESAVGIKYKASADWPTLGKKLRKDMPKVKNALPSLTSEQCKGFLSEGKVTVAGNELVTGDLIVTRYVEMDGEGKSDAELTHDSATDKDVIVILDIQRHPELEAMTLLRSLVSRVNKLRKEAGVKPTDKLDVFYEYDNGVTDDAVALAIVGNEEYVIKSFGGMPQLRAQLGEREVLQVEKRAKEADDLDAGERFVLSLAVRP